MRTKISSIAIYACTHRRNGPLKRLLDSLQIAAKKVQPEVEVGVVIVDDNPDGRAKQVVDGYEGGFARGLHYTHSGAQNISIARNMGIEKSLELADWVAMVDDDQVVVEEWLESLLAVQAQTDADAVTGPVFLRYPEGSPSWLTDEPFAEILEAEPQPDGSAVEVCSTGNSMLRGSFLLANPEIRFRDDLGELGGEDMVFYRAAIAAGLRAHYSIGAVAYGEEPPERSTFQHHLRRSYWMGNSECITNLNSGTASKPRIFVRASKRLLLALARPLRRRINGKSLQWRYSAAKSAQCFGLYAGILGVKVRHK